MNIFVYGGHIPPTMGGEEIHVWELSRELGRKGHSVTLVGSTLEKARFYEKIGTLEVFRIQVINVPIIRTILRFFITTYLLLKQNRKRKFDLIHVHQSVRLPIAYFYAKIIKCPLVLTEHGSIISLDRKRVARFIYGFFIKRTQIIINASQELADYCLKLGARAETTFVFANAIAPDHLTATKDDIEKLRENLGFNKQDKVVLSLRRLVPKNGVHYLVEAFKEVVQALPSIRLVIVGDGSLKQEIESRINKYGLNENVVCVGTVPNYDVPKYIGVSDFAVFPSLAEATSIAALEVMAMGKPVIASDVGGLPEIVLNNKTGLLVPFGTSKSSYIDYGLSSDVVDSLSEAIKLLATDEALRLELGKNAKDNVINNHSWNSYVDKTINLYKQVLPKQRR